MPKISAIIPVFNSQKYLKKCLDSIMNQTFKDFEIIIVNDGSTDDSAKIIDDYCRSYPDKIISFYQENAGQAAARNKGLEKAKGDYIIFIDSDDYIELETFEKTYNYAKEKELDIVCFDFWQERGGVKTESNYKIFNNFENDILYVLNEASPCNKIISRKILEDNKIRFTENIIYEDLELIPTLITYTKKIDFLSERLYVYVIHSGSTMRQKSYNQKLASIYSVVNTLKKKFEGTKYHKELEFLYIEHLLHGAVLRYLNYAEGTTDIIKIADIIRESFPHWRKNKYYKLMNWKYRVVCNLAFYKKTKLLKFLLGEKNE